MRFTLILLILNFYFSYEVGDKISYYDQIKRYDICHGAANNGLGETLSFSDFNGSNSNFHVFFIDMSASWCGPCVSFAQTTMASVEAFYHEHENVRIFTNLDDIGEPYTCTQWGNFGGIATLVTDDGAGSSIWGKFNTGSAYPSTVFIDHTMTVRFKGNGVTSTQINSIINDMLDDLYDALLISANFTHDFNNDVDGDGLINPGDSFDLAINVMNKSYNITNTASNVNIELIADDGIIITSNDLGNIGNINAQDSFLVSANIEIADNIEIDDYLLNMVVTTTDNNGNVITEEFQTDFSVTLNQSGFPADVLGELISSAAIVDIDNDGQDEIISSDKGGFVHVFEMDGTEILNGFGDSFYETGDQNWGSPAVGNLDGDEFDDIVISSKNGNIYVFDYTGLKNTFNSAGGDGYVTATPTLGDIDGDGKDEIIFGQYNNPRYLYAINGDGTNVPGFPISLDEKVQRGVALADFNDNGKMDIVVGTDDEFVHLILDDGTIAWSYETGGDIRVAPTVLELDTGELIVLAGSKDDNFYGFNSDGTVRFTVETDDDIATEASIVDIDGIGPIIFFASGDFVYAVESNGNSFGNWPMDLGAEVVSSITFANVEGYSWPVVMFGDDSGKAHIYSMNGEAYNNFPISYSFPFKGSPTVLDTDADGDLELIIGSTQTLTNIDIKEAGNVDGMWDTHRANMARTGYYKSTVEALSVNDGIQDYEFALYDAYPNPFNPSTTIGYEIPYSMSISLNIYDISGRLVRRLDNGIRNAGMHSIIWDGRDNFGNIVSNGLYIYRLDSDQNISISNKIIFMK